MNSEYIRLWDVIQIMDTPDEKGIPVKFQLKYVTANRLEGTGGDIIELKDSCKCSGRSNQCNPIFSKKKVVAVTESASKDPRHWTHSTRNVLLPNGQIRKVHIRLIIEFNNKKVCY
jgi:hypothetical protein